MATLASRKGDITDRKKAVLDFAIRVSAEAYKVGERDLETVKSHCFTKEDAWDGRYARQDPRFGLTIQNLELMHAGDDEPFVTTGNLHFKRGEWTLLVGESGSGKSSLFKAINGLWPHGRGTIVLPKNVRTLYAAQDVKLPPVTLMDVVITFHTALLTDRHLGNHTAQETMGVAMTLSNDLLHVDIKYECPKCSHPIVRKGSWFKIIASFRCEKCKARVPIGYPDKLAIFEKQRPEKRRLHGDLPKGSRGRRF